MVSVKVSTVSLFESSAAVTEFGSLSTKTVKSPTTAASATSVIERSASLKVIVTILVPAFTVALSTVGTSSFVTVTLTGEPVVTKLLPLGSEIFAASFSLYWTVIEALF